MRPFSPTALSIALPLSLISQMALADLTPAQVWDDWQAYLQDMGYEVSADESTSGADIAVSNLNLSYALPEAGGTMEMTLGNMAFNQNRDGTVAIVMPGTMPIRVNGMENGTGATISAAVNFVQSGHAMTVSGTPDQMTYLYTAETVGMSLVQLSSSEEDIGPDDIRMSFDGTGLRSTTTMTIGDVRSYEQTGSIENLTYDIFADPPENDDNQATIKGTVAGLTFDGNGVIPKGMESPSDLAEMMRAGFSFAGNIGYASGNANFDVKDSQNGNFVMQSSSQGGSLGVGMGQAGVAYDVKQMDVKLAITAQAMPFPIEIAMAESGFKLGMPVAKSDDPQDFALGITLSDFTMSDIIWGMFDPAGQLPRDPATVLVDLSGKVKLLVDWLNPEVASELTGPPGEVQALDLNNLLVSAAGARLEGNGALTFDGTGAPMVPGLGNPVGGVNLALAGGNGLLDKLVSMGLLPEDQAMGARMMMGLFAVPGDAPDTLKSRIEFTTDGQILANGQRIR